MRDLRATAAVASACTGADGSPQAVLDGLHAAVVVSLVAAGLGVAATVARRPSRRAEAAPGAEPALAAADAGAEQAHDRAA